MHRRRFCASQQEYHDGLAQLETKMSQEKKLIDLIHSQSLKTNTFDEK